MKTDLLSESIEDMPIIIDWDLRQQVAFVFEIPTRDIEHVLPPGLRPFEARPGISLTFLGLNDYNPGNTIAGQTQPAFFEVTRFIMVHPDLGVDMPIPRFTFFVHRIGSNNPAFIEQERSALHLPSWYSPSLEVEPADQHLGATVRDKDGIVQTFRNTNPKLIWRDEEFYGQYYTVQDDQLWFGAWYWSGQAFIHQRRGDAGGAEEHPFLTEVEPRWPAAHARRPYMQIISKYDAPAIQVFYAPRCLGSVESWRAQ